MTIKEIRAKTGLTQAQFAQLLGIPKRSVENWEHEVNKCPEYTIKLIDYFLEHEGAYNKGGTAMKKYIMYHEIIEISVKGLKQYGDIFNAHLVENGLRNGNYEIIGEYDTIETAREALKQYTSSVCLTSGFASVKFYSGDLYYFEGSEYDEDYEEWLPGDGDSAKEEVKE